MAKILLTGAGGAGTPTILDSLTALGHQVLTADASLYAAGYTHATRGFVVPFAVDPAFEPAVRRILTEERPDFVVPLVDEEIAIVHHLVAREFPSIRVIAPRVDFCEATLDKWEMYRRMSALGLAVAPTWLASDAGAATYPAIVKPRTGRGSRGLAFLEGPSDLARYLLEAREPHDRYVVQERVPGTEYTTSVVAALDGEVLAVVPKEVLSKKGITQLGVTRDVPAIDALGRDIQAKMRADGPFNVQLMLREDGKPFVFEINPRYSTTAVLTIASGVNEFDEVVRRALGEPPRRLDFDRDLLMIRHAAHTYVRESDWRPEDRRGAPAEAPKAKATNRRVLVTGASGFLGSAVLPRLLRAGWDVTAVANKNTVSASASGVTTLKVDLSDARATRDALAPWRWDAVVHLAGPVPKNDEAWPDASSTLSTHVNLALNLVAAIPSWFDGKFVHVSSMTVFGTPGAEPIAEDAARRPNHAYGLAKRLAEDVITSSRLPDRWILRMGGLFGESRKGGALYHFARAAVRGEPLKIDADKPLPWELLHVDDAVEGIARALESKTRDPGPVNLSYGEPVHLVETAERIAARAKRGSSIVNGTGVVHPRFVTNTGRAKQLLAWPPRSFDACIDAMLAHYAREAGL